MNKNIVNKIFKNYISFFFTKGLSIDVLLIKFSIFIIYIMIHHMIISKIDVKRIKYRKIRKIINIVYNKLMVCIMIFFTPYILWLLYIMVTVYYGYFFIKKLLYSFIIIIILEMVHVSRRSDYSHDLYKYHDYSHISTDVIDYD